MDYTPGSAAQRLAATTLDELDALCASIEDPSPDPDEWFTVRQVADRNYNGNRQIAAYALERAVQNGTAEKCYHGKKRYYRVAKTDETETTETDGAGPAAQDDQAAAEGTAKG